MSDYILTIGCEIHTELKTRSKMFSSAPAQIDQECVPNTLVNEIDLGLPGTLPAPNEHGVVLAIKLAKALKMEIDPNLIFDRKNYFYRDLPKGYQITQQYFPIGKNGSLAIDNGQVIAIERIHIEEDTCKQTKEGDVIKLDYNRAGVPLIEIVSKPVIHSKNDCIKYLEKLRAILTHLDISDGKMENGSLRVDLNISVSNNEHLGTKVEIKNINSFNNVGQAIDYEFQRQVALLTKNEKVDQATRR
jgi:aspartyl-tRNA(Asn)/glutamyl-tRNA(Gln) amidotransferase subunit B